MKPQFSIWIFTLSPDAPPSWKPAFNRIRAADRAGVDRVVLTGEHVVFGENLEAYADPAVGGSEGMKQITGPDGHYLDPIVCMSMIAGMTSRIRFTSNIMLAALRRPIVLAKMTSTLDALSGGRLDLGVGVGWQREEYEAAGLVFENRGRLLDHTLEVCQSLWREQRANYSSPELSFENIHMMPKPVNGDVPVWVSGSINGPVVRRLARFGVGWIPWGKAADTSNPQNLVEALPEMRDAVAKHGRDPSSLQVCGNIPAVNGADGKPAIGPTIERIPALVAAGITDVRLTLPVPDEEAAAEDYLVPWVEAFRAATA